MLSRQSFDDLHAVRPVGLAPQKPHDDHLCMRQSALGVEVDRHGVLQLKQTGQAQGRFGLRQRIIRSRQASKLGISCGENHYVGRVLPEVDGFAAFADNAGLDCQKMHYSSMSQGGMVSLAAPPLWIPG